ncbi:Not1 N-terminal domain, CCR4-Not complex component-domain-containing protein, partial [Baffinella frigidus]
MSSAKKLQGEIDRVLKAVQEGQEVFEDIWEKVHEASTPAQKEKFEGELKTQIKKLQRLREQIKSWITNDAVKDKQMDAYLDPMQPLMDARKRIESDMERFKVCEKETKTKAYSKDGLAAANTNDPETRAKMECRDWVEASIDGLNSQKDSFEAEIEVLRSKSSKKNQKTDREEERPVAAKWKNQKTDREKEVGKTQCMEHIERHNYHVERLEMVMRLLDNDNLSTEDVNTLKDDVEYYTASNEDPDFYKDDDVEYYTASNEDPDFQEDDTIYDVLRLDELNAGTLVDKASKKEKAEEKERREREEAEREANRLREDARKGEANRLREDARKGEANRLREDARKGKANRIREEARKVELEKKRKVEEEKRVKDDQRRQQ